MQPRITSFHNQRIKSAVRLRNRRGRDTQGRILIDGTREIRRAIESGTELLELFVGDQQALADDAAWVAAQAAEQGAAVLTVSSGVFARLAYGARSECLVAVARTPARCLSQLVLPADPLVAVLQQIEKPGNVGAIVRSADAAGVAAVIVADGGTDLYNPNAIRASLGTVFTTPLVSATSVEVLQWLRAREFRILAARVEGAQRFCDVGYQGRVALVLGSEAEGLSDRWLGEGIQSVSIPMLGAADSLNVAAAASILFFEALRQRSPAT